MQMSLGTVFVEDSLATHTTKQNVHAAVGLRSRAEIPLNADGVLGVCTIIFI